MGVTSWWLEVSSASSRPVLVLGALVLAGAALAHAGLNGWVRRQSRREAIAAGSPLAHGLRRWLPRTLAMLAPPAALLIWVHGIALASQLVLSRVVVPPLATAAAGWSYRVALIGALCWLLYRVGVLVDTMLASLASRTSAQWDDVLLPIAGAAARRGLPLLGLVLARPIVAASPALAAVLGDATSLLLIALVAFVLYQAVDSFTNHVLGQYRVDVADNLQARAIYTQVAVLRKVAVATIALFTVASMLMVFEPVRQFGASILASAGIAGIVVGFAAQRSIATLLAGFQIALTQPIRVDDVVIVENEWGRIEDITLTYVVVRIWDLRRLVVPITYFLERPFQNWTRTGSDLLGTVFLYVDYTMPIEPLREELTRILAGSRHWDGKVNVLQVTEAKERTLELRALASARDAGAAWDLRCEIRERLVTFVQDRYRDHLPRTRAAFERETAAAR